MELDAGIAALRITIGLIFAAHGAQKAFGWWKGPGYAGWTGAIGTMGFRPVALWAFISAAAELGAGPLLALGLLTPLAAAGLVGRDRADRAGRVVARHPAAGRTPLRADRPLGCPAGRHRRGSGCHLPGEPAGGRPPRRAGPAPGDGGRDWG